MENIKQLFSQNFRKNIICEISSENTLVLSFFLPDFIKNETDGLIIKEYFPILISDIRQHLLNKINTNKIRILESIPAYDTLLLDIDITQISLNEARQSIDRFLDDLFLSYNRSNIQAHSRDSTPDHVIPVYYGEECALDLKRISQEKNKSTQEIISKHSEKIYTVCAIGFSPGFAYLGFLTPHISHPRLKNPRTHVPSGSVGIADNQTGIYPCDSPGGWNIIGRTPQSMMNVQDCRNPNIFKVGERVQFKSISKDIYMSLGGSFL